MVLRRQGEQEMNEAAHRSEEALTNRIEIHERQDESARKCCWVGGARYGCPLDKTSAKKFQALKRIGENFVIGFSNDTKPRHFVEHARFYLLPQWGPPTIRYLTFFAVSPIVILWLVKRYGVNVLVAQSPYEGFSAAWAKIIARIVLRKKIVLIVESHGDFEKDLFLQRRILFRFIYQFLMQAIATFSLGRADALRAVSKATREQLERWTTGKAIAQFTAWTDIEVFQDAGSSVGRKREKFILYVGVLIPRKGVHFLLESFARIANEIKDSRLVLIGKTDDDGYARLLTKMTARLGLGQRVTFMGPKTQSELAEFMAGAEVLVLPSLSEALGRVVLEAMACGTPVIGSAVGGIPDMIQERKTGFLIPPGDVGALAERLKWILQQPEKAKQIGESARRFAQDFFSEEQYVQNYSDLIDKSFDHASPLV